MEIERKEVLIHLNNDEALILFEWISRINQLNNVSLFQDQAEQRVLFDLESALEKIISEPLEGNYRELISKAWERVRDKEH